MTDTPNTDPDPRLLRPGSLDSPTREVLARYALPDGRPLALFEALAHSPAALTDLRRATAACVGHTTLPVRHREILVLRTVARAGAEAEWAVHVALFGAEAELSAADLDALASPAPPPPGRFTAPERLLVALADALHDTRDVDDALWAALAAHWNRRGLADLLLVATQYAKVALLGTALRIPVPDGLAGFPATRTT